jgi:hypothetical protein
MPRKFNISGSLKVLDEETFSANEVKTVPFSETITLHDDQLEEVINIEQGVGGEVRGEMMATAQLMSNDRIRVGVDLWLYEGTSEGTTDLDGEKHTLFVLQRGQKLSKGMIAYNTDEDAGDYVKTSFTCTNAAA